MQSLYYETVVIGSGFAGRTVASYLPADSYIIVERGEDRSHAETLKRYLAARSQGLSLVEAEAAAYRSDLPWNQVGALSTFNYSRYALIRGGSSNWWGGKASRFSSATFESREFLPWPLSESEIRPWYETAERRLNLTGDPAASPAPPVTALPGAAYWRHAFSPYIQNSSIYNVAVNKASPGLNSRQGYCLGRAHCAICQEDAKARPDTIFVDQPTLYQTLANTIEFDGDSAVAVECYDGKSLFRIECDRVIVAANGVETPRLLSRSELPSSVNRSSLGNYCQDHAHLEIHCRIPKRIAYGALGALSHVVIKELSRVYKTPLGSLETSALALTHEPPIPVWSKGANLDALQAGDTDTFRSHLEGFFTVFVELEVPPQLASQVDLTGDIAQIKDLRYTEIIPHYDQISDEMQQYLRLQGVDIVQVHPFYRHGYGGHHFVGTTNWSRGPENMMEDDNRLGGTTNVYIAGASVIPRAGGVAPTLTLVALAERLGAHLARGSGPPTVGGKTSSYAATDVAPN